MRKFSFVKSCAICLALVCTVCACVTGFRFGAARPVRTSRNAFAPATAFAVPVLGAVREEGVYEVMPDESYGELLARAGLLGCSYTDDVDLGAFVNCDILFVDYKGEDGTVYPVANVAAPTAFSLWLAGIEEPVAEKILAYAERQPILRKSDLADNGVITDEEYRLIEYRICCYHG